MKKKQLATGCIENIIMMVPFSAMVMWTFNMKKKVILKSIKIAFLFSISIEFLQLFLRLGTFQLSDIFYNTLGGFIGGMLYYAVMKVKKKL